MRDGIYMPRVRIPPAPPAGKDRYPGRSSLETSSMNKRGMQRRCFPHFSQFFCGKRMKLRPGQRNGNERQKYTGYGKASRISAGFSGAGSKINQTAYFQQYSPAEIKYLFPLPESPWRNGSVYKTAGAVCQTAFFDKTFFII